MLQIWIFVAGGKETDTYRDIAKQVIGAVERMFVHGLSRDDVVLRHWDYREDPPDLLPAGELASKSLRLVDRSGAVIAILGADIPRITGKEIRRAIEQYTARRTDKVWLFVDAEHKGDNHRSFLNRLKKQYHVDVQYQEFTGEQQFQERVFVALTPYVVKRAFDSAGAS